MKLANSIHRLYFLSLFAGMSLHLMAVEPAIIPRPLKMEGSGRALSLEHATITADPLFRAEAEMLGKELRAASGSEIPAALTSAGGAIVLTSSGAKDDLGPEGYILETGPSTVTIRAKTAAGIFYGGQTLLQLLPERPAAGSASDWMVPGVRIEDRPYLPWRGFMFDEARHFFGKQMVESLLDRLASMKFNVFHWHLTDDQGWRIEIKKYPRLTAIGAWRQRNPKVDGPGEAQYGGFYTQADIREIVAYATARHIQVVPEIEMPGHSAAAMTAYPDLAPENGWTPSIVGIAPGTYCMCVAKPRTVQFCKDVLDETFTLFPSNEIHIGGDEVNDKQWEDCPVSQAALKKSGLKDFADLQIRFQNEMIAYVESKGRHAIVWNNTCRPTVDKRAINQFWRPDTMNAARTFASLGYKIFNSDSSVLYYDHVPPLQKAYDYDPIGTRFPGAPGVNVAGAEACQWTEHHFDLKSLELSIYPLIYAHSECLWTAPERKDWNSFVARLAVRNGGH